MTQELFLVTGTDTSDKGWACSSLPVLRCFGMGASCNMLRLAPPPRSLQTVLTELDNTCKCNSTLRYGLSCFPEMSDGHLQANARGGVSGETTSQLYALLL